MHKGQTIEDINDAVGVGGPIDLDRCQRHVNSDPAATGSIFNRRHDNRQVFMGELIDDVEHLQCVGRRRWCRTESPSPR